MRKILTILFIFLFIPTLAFSQCQYVIEKVIDGDTIRLRSGQLSFNVRLVGIDCPEVARKRKPGQPFGDKAKSYLFGLTGRFVTIKGYNSTDRYNRPLVEMFYKTHNLNQSLLIDGLAEVYQGRTPRGFMGKAFYLKIQELAKKNKKGIWSLKKRISPREWRKRNTGSSKTPN